MLFFVKTQFFTNHDYRVTQFKWLPKKNPECFSKNHETWSILSSHEMVIPTNFRNT